MEAFNLGVYALLREKFPRLKTEKDFSFARHTTIGCGGIAAAAAYPAEPQELQLLLQFLVREGIPYVFLGAGANVLPADGFFEGVAVRFSLLNRLERKGNLLYAGAGVTGGALCRYARENCIGGYEPFTGIPMTVGGATVMNAGVRGGHVSDVIHKVIGIEKGEIRDFYLADCRFSEKTSIFQSGIAVCGAVLRADFCSPDVIEKNTAEYRSRRAHLPKGRSMGCTFVNPQGQSAGKIIEACGLKGLRVGGAHVSREHANFIINDDATATEVAELIDTVKKRVQEMTGICLREEIRRLPH